MGPVDPFGSRGWEWGAGLLPRSVCPWLRGLRGSLEPSCVLVANVGGWPYG